MFVHGNLNPSKAASNHIQTTFLCYLDLIEAGVRKLVVLFQIATNICVEYCNIKGQYLPHPRQREDMGKWNYFPVLSLSLSLSLSLVTCIYIYRTITLVKM